MVLFLFFFFFSSRRRHTRFDCDWSSDVCSSDLGWPGYEEVPGWIVDGYSTLFAEVDEQLADAGAAGPGLVAIPAGVGSLAQAGVTHYRSRPGSHTTALLTVEPGTAACVLASLVRGELGTISTGETIMA